jgi:hypothetical protein
VTRGGNIGPRFGVPFEYAVSVRLFQSTRLLAGLNVFAVGASLAAMTAVLLQRMMDLPALGTGASTLLVGCAWAVLLRWPRRVMGLRAGWILSVPLAALNATLAGIIGTIFAEGFRAGSLGWMVVLLPTVGAILWVPALALTLLLFGVPIAWAQRLAEKGLAGTERGEWIVGALCVAMSVFALAILFGGPGSSSFSVVVPLAGAAIWAGASSTAIAVLREARRRAFVKRVAAGEETAFRLVPTKEGNALVRIDEHGGYRVAYADEVAVLDEAGEVVRAAGRVLNEG